MVNSTGLSNLATLQLKYEALQNYWNMKTDTEIQKKFDSVLYFRKIKEQIARELAGKSFQEQKEYIQKVLSGEIKLNISI